jgi:PAS domain S-box-containing protein
MAHASDSRDVGTPLMGEPSGSVCQGEGGAVPRADAVRFHTRLMEAMADAVVVTDAEFHVTLWNPAAERLYGYSAEEALGRPAWGLASYEGDPARLALEGALDRNGLAHLEFEARTKSGTVVCVELIATAVHDQSGAVVGHLGIHRDITERKRSATEQHRLSAIVQNSADFIGMAELDGRAVFVNDAGRGLLGLRDLDAVRALHLIDFFAPEHRDAVRDRLLPQIIADGGCTNELDLVNFETGDHIPVSCQGLRVDDPQTGQPIAIATISRDLREQRRAAAELQASRRQIDTIFASITDAFCAFDRDLRFTYVNDRAVQICSDVLGAPLDRDDCLGSGLFTMFPEVAGSDVERNFRLALRDRRTIVFEFLHATTGRWFDVHVYPTEDGLAVYFDEITARKLAEHARERQARQQAAVAELGVRGSRGDSAIALMEEAVAVVSRALNVELVAVAELLPDHDRLLLRAGVGWEPGRVGHAESATSARSLVGYAAQTGEPVVCADVMREERCRPSELLVEHGVASAAVVAIPGRSAPFGGLGVFSREPRRFRADEVDFLRAVAHVLHSAIERAQTSQRIGEVRDAERRRLARALHDETLEELGIALAHAVRGATDGGDEGLVDALQRVGEQLRAAIHDLRLGDGQGRPFPTLVEELAEHHRARMPDCAVDVVCDVHVRLSSDMRTEVLRILGEAITNARRHAAAGRIEVRLAVEGASLVAVVADDGRGLEAARSPGAAGGHGIAGMRERAALLGGKLGVTRGAGGGTVVELRAPLRGPGAIGDRARVLLVDDHAAVRDAMALAFAEDHGFVVAGAAGSLAEARTMLDGIDVAIVDVALPDGDGMDLIPELRAANADARALVLSAETGRSLTARAVQRGAAAVVSKAAHLHDVVAIVRRLHAGETIIPLDEVVELLRHAGEERERELEERQLVDSLTAREREVLQFVADGLDSRRIAARLHISPRTQRNHMANILGKLGVHSQLQALIFALRHGVVEVPRGRGSAEP